MCIVKSVFQKNIQNEYNFSLIHILCYCIIEIAPTLYERKIILEDFKDRLKNLRSQKKFRQKDLATKLGIARTTIANYEQGTRFPDKETLKNIANFFDVSIDYLLGRSDYPNYWSNKIVDFNQLVEIPILGVITAGKPILAQENIEDYRLTSKADVKGGNYFFLKVNGDSMIGSRIHSGDLVLIRKQEDVENGTIGVVMVNDEEATLKRIYKKNNHIILQPDNPKYEPIILSNQDVKIIGKVVKVEFDL